MVLRAPNAKSGEMRAVSDQIQEALGKIADLPVLPSEAEDILSISFRERHKWLKDGRLKSIETRTVKLRGRAKAVTFHVFAPRHIEDILDGDLPALWRGEDAQAALEGRRRAAAKAALARKNKRIQKPHLEQSDADKGPSLLRWEDFDAEGLLR